MKYLGTIIFIIVFALVGYFGYNFLTTKPVSERKFRKAHRYLNYRIDTLRNNQHKMLTNQKVLYRNQQILRDSLASLSQQMRQIQGKLDSLQSQVKMLYYGQTVIYDALTSSQPSKTSKSKFQKLIDWFRGK